MPAPDETSTGGMSEVFGRMTHGDQWDEIKAGQERARQRREMIDRQRSALWALATIVGTVTAVCAIAFLIALTVWGIGKL